MTASTTVAVAYLAVLAIYALAWFGVGIIVGVMV